MVSDLFVLQAQVLALMAWADGEFDDSERQRFRDYLEASPGTDALRVELFRMAVSPPDLQEVLQAFARCPSEAASTVLKSAYLMAEADGHLHENERALVDQLAQSAGVRNEDLPRLREMLVMFLEAHKIERELFNI